MSEATLAAIAGRLPTPDDTPGEPLRQLLVLDLSRCQHVYDSLLLPVAESCRGLAALSLSGSLFKAKPQPGSVAQLTAGLQVAERTEGGRSFLAVNVEPSFV